VLSERGPFDDQSQLSHHRSLIVKPKEYSATHPRPRCRRAPVIRNGNAYSSLPPRSSDRQLQLSPLRKRVFFRNNISKSAPLPPPALRPVRRLSSSPVPTASHTSRINPPLPRIPTSNFRIPRPSMSASQPDSPAPAVPPRAGPSLPFSPGNNTPSSSETDPLRNPPHPFHAVRRTDGSGAAHQLNSPIELTRFLTNASSRLRKKCLLELCSNSVCMPWLVLCP
jgi:hypothetical protein